MPNALVIEDEAELAWAVAEELEAIGFVTDIVNTLDQAVDSMARRSYRLIVADLILRADRTPHVQNTLATIFRAKRRAPNCTIIAMSGSLTLPGMEGALSTAAQLGADHTLGKPFDMQELIDIARDIWTPA